MTAHAKYNLTSSDGTTPQFGLGDEINVCGAQYKYCIAEGAVAAYALCLIEADGDVIEATTTLVGTAARPTTLGVPQFAMADEEYGWVAVGPFGPFREDGSTTFKVLAANAATSVRLYTTGTAGVVDDAVTTGLVAGLALTETVTTQEAADCVAVTRLVSFCEL
jgi:hypothetical protein